MGFITIAIQSPGFRIYKNLRVREDRQEFTVTTALTLPRPASIAVERATAYREAGADCLCVPFVSEGETIARLAAAIPGPLNILAVAGTPSIPELQSMGVARVSIGSGPYRAALGLVRRIAEELHQTGTYTTMTDKWNYTAALAAQ